LVMVTSRRLSPPLSVIWSQTLIRNLGAIFH